MGQDEALDDLFKVLEKWYKSYVTGRSFHESQELLFLAYQDWQNLIKEDASGEEECLSN